jgi:hypothetical protein
MTHSYRALFLLSAFLLCAILTGPALADPCLVVYPTGPCMYHYDVTEYMVVGPGDPYYDPAYDINGQCLIDLNDMMPAADIYQAPELMGFQPSSDGKEGYFFEGYSFTLVVDGFSNEPTTYENIMLVVEPLPASCPPMVVVDGTPMTSNMLSLGDLLVSTPTEEGNNYSDVMMLEISWAQCAEMEFWAFADENYNGVKDGGECFSAFSHDSTVPSEEKSFGTIKVRFSGEPR